VAAGLINEVATLIKKLFSKILAGISTHNVLGLLCTVDIDVLAYSEVIHAVKSYWAMWHS